MEANSDRMTIQVIAEDGAERLDPGEPVDGAAPGRRQRVSTQEKKSQANESTVQRARGENGTDCQPLRSAPSLPAPPVSSTRPTHLPRARRKWREHAIPSTLTTIGVDPLEALPGQGADRARTERHHPPLPSPQLNPDCPDRADNPPPDV